MINVNFTYFSKYLTFIRVESDFLEPDFLKFGHLSIFFGFRFGQDFQEKE